jgi:hypothetical protein
MAMRTSDLLNRTQNWLQTLVVFVVIASLLVSCRFPWQTAPTPQPEETETPEQSDEPTPTPEPRPDLPPALVEVSPLPKSVIDLKQPFTMVFNQTMDADSVIAAIQFEPDINGGFTWEDDQTLTFTPDQSLPPETLLSVTIQETAQAANKKSLQEPVTFNYNTAGYLALAEAIPADGSKEVDPQNPIIVTFTQPVAPLGGEAEAPPAFTLTPEAEGRGEWLNTSTFVFFPEPVLEGGTAYTLTLNDSLVSTAGSPFAADQILEHSFTTSAPAIVNVLPLLGNRLSLDGPIRIQFNIRMDAQSVQDSFSLTDPNGIEIEGSFEWDEDQRGFMFTPERNLDRDSVYTIQLGSDAQSFGGMTLETSLNTTRQTYPAFSVSSDNVPSFDSYYGEYGSYKIPFTVPLKKINYTDVISIEPEINGLYIYSSDQVNTLRINGYFKPETTYTISLSEDLQDTWGDTLGQTRTFSFMTPPAEPTMTVISGEYSNQLVFVPATTSELVLQATNIDELRLMLSPITVEDLITLLHPDNYDYRQVFMPESLEVTTRTLDLTPNINQVVTVPLTYQGLPLDPGVYYLELSSDDLPQSDPRNYQRLFLIVSNKNIVMKTAPEQTLVWITHLEDFSAAADVPVSIYHTEGTRLTSGSTDASGLFMGSYERFSDPYSKFFCIAGEPGEDSFAFSSSSWGQGYALYRMGIRYNPLPPFLDSYIYTDRPIYRPGDTVHFKAVIYRQDNGQPMTAPLEAVTVKIYGDPGVGGMPIELFSEDLLLSPFGTVNGSINLPENAVPGYYHIEIAAGEKTIGLLYFDVAAYRKPELELDLSLSKEESLSGEDLSATLQAQYYFGMPGANQPFSWTLYSDTVAFHLPGYRVGPLNTGWLMPRMMDYGAEFGESIDSGGGVTDENGTASLDFSSPVTGDDPGVTRRLHLEATLMDNSGFPVSTRQDILVHPDSVYIGVKPEAYFGAAENPFAFSVLTVDWDQQAVGEIPLEATFEQIEWQVETTTDPTMPYIYTPVTTFVASASPVTDSEGQARLSFTPPNPGTYQLTITSGNALTQVLVWVSGASSAVWPAQQQNRIELTPDSETYQPGQIAQIFFPNPFPEGAKALVTTERGEIMSTQVLEITGAGYTLDIPLNEDAIPNLYVSVMLFGINENGDPDYRQGVINLPVAPISQILNVALTLNPQNTVPGGRVTATLKITDQQGQPVQGEFSVAVIDKAVLALVDPNSPAIAEALYGQQPLAVQTSFSLLTYATQLSLISMEMGRGGGGGDIMATPQLREDFPDTAFWQAEVVTGADGTAILEIPTPDSLTTWVVDVRGLTDRYQVGQATAEIITSKDLMIRPVTPRFLVDGDEVEMAAIVHNNTDAALVVDVSLQAIGFTLMDDSAQTQQVEIPAGGNARVAWWGVVESVSSADLVFQAVSGDLSDASKPVWGDLPVLQYTMPMTFSTAGQLTGPEQRLELVSLPISADPRAGSLDIELTPSLTAALTEGLNALEAGSPQDTISVLSRFLANLQAYQALTSLGIESPQMEDNLEDLVTEGLHALLDSQNVDGGWSWWPRPGAYDIQSDPFITAYAILGLRQAQDTGLNVNDYVLDQAVTFLSTQLTRPQEIDTTWKLDRLVFQIYALGDAPINLSPYIEGLYSRRSELSSWALALLALVYEEQALSNNRINTLITDLEGSAIRSATGVHWESSQTSWMLPGTPVFNTSVVVFALAKLDPASTTLSPALRYIMAHRQSNRIWHSTFESAWALMGITEALLGTGSVQASYAYEAFLNDTPIAEGSVDSVESLTPIAVNIPMESLYPDAPNALLFERTDGSGTLYYRADLKTYQPAAEAPPINQGISLNRAYVNLAADCDSLAACPEINQVSLNQNEVSQPVTVVLTLTISHDMYHLILEDYIPAGSEIVNKGLNTTQMGGEEGSRPVQPQDLIAGNWGAWFFNQPQIFDDHILWTADFLPAGTYTLTYEILPLQKGQFQVLPAHAWQYFYPEVQGTSAGDIFSIE